MDVPNLGNRGVNYGLLLLIGAVLLGVPFVYGLQTVFDLNPERIARVRAARLSRGEPV